ncbi:MAG TPA: GAF domain-containing protein, partial [Bacteroidales bacterium]|nr:GAF domain-containing protein [Bacteroidales bacterium]
MTKYEVEDPAHWFSQNQADRFQEALVEKTGNLDIAREAGRYASSSEGLGPVKQYTLGFIKPTSVFLLMEKIYPNISRGSTINANKLRSDKVEIISTPKPGVNERPYQCENRIGIFESLAKYFTDRFANVEHPSCFHKGHDCCRYIITWKSTSSLIWKRIRNYSLLISIVVGLGLFFVLPLMTWGWVVLICSVITMFFSLFSDQLEKKELSETIKTQGDAAKDLLDEMTIRQNNALLIQEIGQATASILNTDTLLEAVVRIMEMRTDFDRGMIMLADSNRLRLFYTVGYGYDKETAEILKHTAFHLDNPESKGVFVVAFKNKKPFLINDIAEIEKKLSKRSLEFAKKIGVHSLICVPIVYENESLGILAVDNVKSKRSLTKSDINFLMGVASQTAAGIINASSFQKIQESEKKYRELVENANSIIMRRDIDGNITFFNEFAQKFFGYSENEILGKSLEGTIFPNTESTRNHLERLLRQLKQNPEHPIVNENE